MNQQLRAVTVFPEDLGSVPRTYKTTHNSQSTVLGDSVPSSGLSEDFTHGIQSYVQTKHQTHKIK